MIINVDGAPVYAATGGRPFDAARPAAILVHGAGMDHTAWSLQARWLAWHGWSVLAVDLPGHGRSGHVRSGGEGLASIEAYAGWIERLMAAAGIERAALIGHSMGAAIALEAAARLGVRATHLALLGISSTMPVAPALQSAAASAPEQAYAMMTGWSLAPQARMGGNPVPGLWMAGGTRALLARNAAGTLARDLAACHAWTGGPEAAKRVECPTLVICGALDVMTPARKAAELAKLLASAETIVIAGSGHMMMAEAPDATLDALIRGLGAVA